MHEIRGILDPGIADLVHLLRSQGINTFASCEGGDGHAFIMPTVRVEPADPIDMRAETAFIAGVLSRAGYDGYYLKQVQAYQKGPWPWQADPMPHFIEIEFWYHPLERK